TALKLVGSERHVQLSILKVADAQRFGRSTAKGAIEIDQTKIQIGRAIIRRFNAECPIIRPTLKGDGNDKWWWTLRKLKDDRVLEGNHRPTIKNVHAVRRDFHRGES